MYAFKCESISNPAVVFLLLWAPGRPYQDYGCRKGCHLTSYNLYLLTWMLSFSYHYQPKKLHFYRPTSFSFRVQLSIIIILVFMNPLSYLSRLDPWSLRLDLLEKKLNSFGSDLHRCSTTPWIWDVERNQFIRIEDFGTQHETILKSILTDCLKQLEWLFFTHFC